MEKAKRNFKLACYAVLGYVAVSVIDLIVSLIRGIDVSNYMDYIAIEYKNYVIAAYIVVAVVFILLHLWLVSMGLKRIKDPSKGNGHMVLEFILSIFAFFNLYSVIEMVSSPLDRFTVYWSFAVAIIWTITLLVYDWCALQLNHVRKEEAKKEQ